MKLSRIFLLLLTASIPITAVAGVNAGDLPGDTIWYLHADLKQMRTLESGGPLYDWLDGEVVVEINDQLDIDVNAEIESVTAFSDENLGTVILVGGPLSKDSQNKMLALASKEADLDHLDYDDMVYYHVGDDEEDHWDNESDPLDDLEDSAYFSFALANKMLITSNEEQMKALLESGGKIAGSGSVDGAMFVLTADKSFVQAGLRPDGMADDDDDDWESNIIRNTDQAALLISDSDGQIALEAQLLSTDPKMAQSIGGIVNGLISLQTFNTELGPELQNLIQNTKVTVTENLLSISTIIDPELVVNIMTD